MNNEEIFEYMTKNRKLKLEEYDDNGNVIDTREFGSEDLYKFMNLQNHYNNPLSVARKKDLEGFTEEQLNIIQELITYTKLQHSYGNAETEIYWFTEKESIMYKGIFEHIPHEHIEMAIELVNGCQPAFNTTLKSPYAFKKFTLGKALEFIKEREGIYYTIDNEGKRIYDFVDKPTKKQAKYQRQKNGNRTVFLSFKEWKEYTINEDELE